MTLNIKVIDAVYGSQLAAADVTARVQSLVDLVTSPPATSVVIGADDASLGIDPSPGIHKHLTVRYSAFGLVRTAACEEGQSVTLSEAVTASSIIVLGAVYGAEQGSEDVTATVQDLVIRGITDITADDNTFGDPAVGHLKNFGMLYTTIGGGTNALACQEGQTVKIT